MNSIGKALIGVTTSICAATLIGRGAFKSAKKQIERNINEHFNSLMVSCDDEASILNICESRTKYLERLEKADSYSELKAIIIELRGLDTHDK